MYLVLLMLSVNLFASNQSANLTNYKLACSYKDTKLQDDSCRVVSSANNIENKFVALGRSLISKRNKMGPSTDPWGTPHVSSLMVELALLTNMYCILPVR